MSTNKEETKQAQRFSWKKATNLLSDTEKNRICCLLLTCFEQIKPTGEDFELAAAQFGAAKGGFAKMYQTTLKKLKDANAYIIEGENVDDIPSTRPATPAKGPKKGAAGAKRKAASSGASEDNVNGGEAKPAAKKPRASPKKKSPAKVKEEGNDEAEVTDDGKDEDKGKDETKIKSPDSVLGSDFEMVDAEAPKE